MKEFKEFNIKTSLQNFVGEKIYIHRIINREVIVHDFKVEKSKFDTGDGKCLYIQIEVDSRKHILFTGSKALRSMIEQVPREDFPFKTVIIEEADKSLKFT
jgi:ribosomal protein L31